MKKIIVDYEANLVTQFLGNGQELSHEINTPQAFSVISQAYLRTGWDNKYVYSFSWLGRPVIQLPDDMIRIQELIYELKPDVIVEIGVAHGGSLIFYASLMEAIGKGRIIGVDLEIRRHNREAIEQHRMFHRIQLIEGDSISLDTFNLVKSKINERERVLVLLDGNHSYKHVTEELVLYSSLVSLDSYILAMDGIQRDLVGAPRSQPDWSWNNSANAAEDFVDKNPAFKIINPQPVFNEGNIVESVTYWPSAYLKRIK